MTQEEKAKAYDEALALMQDCIPDENGLVHVRPEDIFPALKESKDERIRNVIRGWIYTRPASFFDNGISKEEMLAWLEKQGEQKPTLRERYKNIAESEWFKRTHEGMSVSDDEESKWTEEDEELLQHCCGAVAAADYYTLEDKEEMENWLKSLKQRIAWKPNKEQIKALHDLNLTGNISYAGQGQLLIELYNDLKKLIV